MMNRPTSKAKMLGLQGRVQPTPPIDRREPDSGVHPPTRAVAARANALQKILASLWSRHQVIIATLATTGILVHLLLRFAVGTASAVYNAPLWLTLSLGGGPLVGDLLIKLARRQFGSDLLAGIAIVTSALLGEYLAGALVVLMLSGGESLEGFAVRSASSVLRALARRMPSVAHRKTDTTVIDVPLSDVAVGDTLLVFPHEICPVDGVVTDGHGVMLVLPNKDVWNFTAPEDLLELEESVFLGGLEGPRRTVQIVIAGQAAKVGRVRWTLVHTPAQPPATGEAGAKPEPAAEPQPPP